MKEYNKFFFVNSELFLILFVLLTIGVLIWLCLYLYCKKNHEEECFQNIFKLFKTGLILPLIFLCLGGIMFLFERTTGKTILKKNINATENYRDEFLSSISGIENNNIIWLNWPIEPCWINIPCPKYDISVSPSETQDECIAMIDIGIRRLTGSPFKLTDTKDVYFPKDGWKLKKNEKGDGDVIFRVSKDGRKLMIAGKKPGNVILQLSHKDCLYAKDILITVTDWDTWQQRGYLDK